MRTRNRYAGPAVARIRGVAGEVAVIAELYWGSMPTGDVGQGRVFGILEPAYEAGVRSVPIGHAELTLPDGSGVVGEVVSRFGHGCAFSGPAPYIPATEGGIDGHYVVSMGGMVGWPELGLEKPFREVIEELSARLGITVSRTSGSGGWFCAALTEDQLDRVRSEPGVLRVVQDAKINPALVFLEPSPHGIEGEYIVSVRNAVDPVSVAARLNIDIRHTYDGAPGFSARMTAADVDRARHDPDVTIIRQNSIGYLD